MFEISGILGEKFHPDGYILRMKNVFKQPLNTEAGVIRFLLEQRPFAEFKVIMADTKEDKTEYFLAKVKEADERSNG